jgi:cytochrome P450
MPGSQQEDAVPGTEPSRRGISPMPPVAAGVGLPWDVPVTDAVAVLAGARREHGDTFVVESGQDRYLFTFSATGVESFYALPEEKASKGVADYLMLRRKLPEEIFEGRRTLPGSLFRKGDVAGYLTNLRAALETTTAELGEDGEADVFAVARRLAHRMGLASWAGPGCDRGTEFERLVVAFDALDGAEAFVHPDAMAAVAASGKSAERAALAEITAVVGAAVDRLDAHPDPEGQSLFARIVTAWDGEPAEVRRAGVAWDVALIHVASMSNLAAALGWALVDLVEHPDEQARVLGGDPSDQDLAQEFAQQCVLESTRLAQRSIMSRTVLAPVELDDGDEVYTLDPGATVATLLPLTNTEAPGYGDWLPARWNRSRLADPGALGSPQLVTAFGHGKHSCPAQPFSVAAMTLAVTHLLGAFEIEAGWSSYPVPVPAQIGGVARAQSPCMMRYRTR